MTIKLKKTAHEFEQEKKVSVTSLVFQQAIHNLHALCILCSSRLHIFIPFRQMCKCKFYKWYNWCPKQGKGDLQQTMKKGNILYKTTIIHI